MKRGYVVQDLETSCFLAPVDGDVGLVRELASAGVFYDADEAENALVDHCGGLGSVYVMVCNDDWSLCRG